MNHEENQDTALAFCGNPLRVKIIRVLQDGLFRGYVSGQLPNWYESMAMGVDEPTIASLGSVLIDDTVFAPYLSKKKEIRNLGIDLPVWFGDSSETFQRMMIVAKDPKRIGQNDRRISLNSVFSLHSLSGRETKRNDYWRFIRPFIQKGFVYMTDLYKLYYETAVVRKGISQHLVSNKDKSFIGRGTIPYEKNMAVLAAEIKEVRPTRIVAFGKEAANALCSIQGIQPQGPKHLQGGIEYVFVPHISRTVTQSIKTIANLYITTGILRSNEELSRIGEAMLEQKSAIYGGSQAQT